MNIRKITKTIFIVTLTALVAGLISCDRAQQILKPTIPQPGYSSEEISIGFVAHLTGQFSSASGLPMKMASELALEEINAAHAGSTTPQIRFITVDSQSTAEGAIAAYKQLIHEDGVSVILGPTISTTAKAAFPVAQENRVVALSPTSAAIGISALGDFVFRNSLTVDKLIQSGVSLTQEALGYQEVATIADSGDVFSQSSDEVLQKVLTENGVKILTTETFGTGDTDFSTQLTRIKESDPDAIFISAQTNTVPLILIQARALGISAETPIIVTLTLTPDAIAAAGDASEGVMTFTSWSSEADTPGNQAFVANYKAKYGIEPGVLSAQSYASVYILAKAIADAGSTEAPAVQQAMAQLTGFDTILGRFSFDSVGDGVYQPVTLIVKDGKLKNFEAAAVN